MKAFLEIYKFDVRDIITSSIDEGLNQGGTGGDNAGGNAGGGVDITG